MASQSKGLEVYPDVKEKFNAVCMIRGRGADVMEALILCFIENEMIQAEVMKRVAASDRPASQQRGRSEVRDIDNSLERFKTLISAQNPGKSLAKTTTALVEAFLETAWIRDLVKQRLGSLIISDSVLAPEDSQDCQIPETTPILTR